MSSFDFHTDRTASGPPLGSHSVAHFWTEIVVPPGGGSLCDALVLILQMHTDLNYRNVEKDPRGGDRIELTACKVTEIGTPYQ